MASRSPVRIFGAGTWRGHRSLHSGLIPTTTAVLNGRSAQGCRALRRWQVRLHVEPPFPLIAADREQIVTLHPELVITGRVSDAETGRPLPKFRLIRGHKYEGTGRDLLGRE